MDIELSIVIPTYNEKENIQKLLALIQEEFDKNKINGEIIVVDDNSPDGTGEMLDKLKSESDNLRVLHRQGKLGLSSAVLEGWKIAEGNILGVMDADLSHPPEKINEMLRIIQNDEADLVIGSRYVKGGEIKGWNLKRKAMSRGATLLAKVFTKVKDPMTGFFMIKKHCVEGKELNPKGFKILLEVLIKANYTKVKEVPIVFINREKGKSKAGTKEIFYLLGNLIGYFPYKKKALAEFFKFASVGLIGTGINLGILYLFTEKLGFYYMLSAVIAFIIAASHNFVINKIWTFKEKLRYDFLKKYLKFISVSISALLINLFFLYIFTELFEIYYLISQVLAIGIGLIINFFGNKKWTFSK